jgi:hypothetical protein
MGVTVALAGPLAVSGAAGQSASGRHSLTAWSSAGVACLRCGSKIHSAI